jgi:glutathione S-transferase
MMYQFYYWPGIQGRGEFVRLAFEAVGAPYHDVAREDGIAAMTRRMTDASIDTPPFAPPFLVHNDVVVAQVAAILHYVAPQLGLVPADERLRLWAHQIQLTMTDIVAEVHDTHHPVGTDLYYDDQKPEALRRAEGFITARIPKYAAWLELILARNPAGPGHMVGDRLSYVDLSVFQLIEGLRYAFPRAMRGFGTRYPGLQRVHHRVKALKAVAAYLASDRRIPFNEDGIFRRYPELDIG